MNVTYPSGEKSYAISTPWRKKAVRQLARKSYRSLGSAAIASDVNIKVTLASITQKIKKELQNLCSLQHDSILRDTIEAVWYFSWGDRLVGA